MKRFNKSKEYIMIAHDKTDLIKVESYVKNQYVKTINNIPEKYDLCDKISMDNESKDPEINVTNQLLTNGLTRLKSLENVSIYENHKTTVLEFDIPSFEERNHIYKWALKTYSNVLNLGYVPKPIYNYFAKKIMVTNKTTEIRDVNNMKDRLEKRNAKYDGNSISLELYTGEMNIENLDEFLAEREDLKDEIDLKRKDPEYLEDMKLAKGEVIHLNGLKTLRIEIAKNFAFKNIKYNDFGFTRLGFTNYCLLYTSPSPRDLSTSRMPSSA